jgi:hypothetical protein
MSHGVREPTVLRGSPAPFSAGVVEQIHGLGFVIADGSEHPSQPFCDCGRRGYLFASTYIYMCRCDPPTNRQASRPAVIVMGMCAPQSIASDGALWAMQDSLIEERPF